MFGAARHREVRYRIHAFRDDLAELLRSGTGSRRAACRRSRTTNSPANDGPACSPDARSTRKPARIIWLVTRTGRLGALISAPVAWPVTAKPITPPKKTGREEPAPQGALLNTGGEWEGGRGPPRAHRSCERCLAGGTRPDISRACANYGFRHRINELASGGGSAACSRRGEPSQRDDMRGEREG